MIPKKIHYCWFGGAEMSPFIKKCISTWKKYLPDYELVLWDESRFDLNSVKFVKKAYEAKKWAFVADYVRFHALYNEGGLYLDTDIKVLRTFPKEWLDKSFFSSHEVHPSLFNDEQIDENFLPALPNGRVDGISILSAIMGAEKGHPFLKNCLNEYSKIDFLEENGKIINLDEIIIAQVLFRNVLSFGYICKDVKQELSNNMLILPSNVLVGNSIFLDDNSYAIHLVNSSWTEKTKWEEIMHKTRNYYPIFFPILSFINKVLRRLKFI